MLIFVLFFSVKSSLNLYKLSKTFTENVSIGFKFLTLIMKLDFYWKCFNWFCFLFLGQVKFKRLKIKLDFYWKCFNLFCFSLQEWHWPASFFCCWASSSSSTRQPSRRFNWKTYFSLTTKFCNHQPSLNTVDIRYMKNLFLFNNQILQSPTVFYILKWL